MGCCGEKRKAWERETRSSANNDFSENEFALPASGHPERVFEYTGRSALRISGAVSGKSYHFRFPGDKVMVDSIDAFALMAETDLKLTT
jgi:hypothetical protein